MNKKIYFKVLALTVFCLLSIVMLVFFAFSGGGDKELDGMMDKKQANERHNILILGTDKDETRADVIMICSVRKKDKTLVEK